MKKQIFMKTASLLLSLFMFSSCATLFTKGSYDIPVKSNPPANYVVKLKGKTVFQGETPDVLKLKSGGFIVPNKYTFEFTKKGYKKTVYTTGTRVKGAIILSFLLGLAPVAIDFATGKAYGINTEKVEVNLSKDE